MSLTVDEYYAGFKELDYTLETFVAEKEWLEEYVRENFPKDIPVLEDKKRIAALNRLIEEINNDRNIK